MPAAPLLPELDPPPELLLELPPPELLVEPAGALLLFRAEKARVNELEGDVHLLTAGSASAAAQQKAAQESSKAAGVRAKRARGIADAKSTESAAAFDELRRTVPLSGLSIDLNFQLGTEPAATLTTIWDQIAGLESALTTRLQDLDRARKLPEFASKPPMPGAAKPGPAETPLHARSIVPGWRNSARVAARASDAGSSPTAARSASGIAADNCCNTLRRWSGVSRANASACAASMVSGGAVRSR